MKQPIFDGSKLGRSNQYTLRAPKRKANAPYYFLSNDVVSKNQFTQKGFQDGVFIGVGNIHSLHVLSNIIEYNQLREINFIDINVSQLRHLHKIIKLIISSKDRVDFVENFFAVELSRGAREILKKIHNFDRGVTGYKKWNFLSRTERAIWKDSVLNTRQFKKQYLVNATMFDGGLTIENSPNFGGITKSTYHIFDCAEVKMGFEPFTLGYGSGFLRSEEIFARIQKELKNITLTFIVGDIASESLKILTYNKYFPIFIWTSNIFDKYFTSQFPHLLEYYHKLIELGTQKEPIFPEYELFVYYDERTKVKFPNQLKKGRKKASSHTYAFRRIASLITDKTLEIVSNQNWINEDRGESKLLLTDYSTLTELSKKVSQYECYFLHCLLGKELSKTKYLALLNKLLKTKKKIIILEHNGDSREFASHSDDYFKMQELTMKTTKPLIAEYIRGEYSTDRNILLVYKR